MSKISTYIDGIKAGHVAMGDGGVSDGRIGDGAKVLQISAGAESITAEAYNLGIFGEDDPWEDSLRKIREALS